MKHSLLLIIAMSGRRSSRTLEAPRLYLKVGIADIPASFSGGRSVVYAGTGLESETKTSQSCTLKTPPV